MELRSLLADVPLLGAEVALDMEINSISRDGRTVKPGGVFIAVQGTQQDGHEHIAQALEHGAAAVVCECLPQGDGPWILVKDSRAAYAQMCANWFGRPEQKLTLVAVTGTNGKTTTTSLLKELLERVLGTKVGLIGTNRNMVGETEIPASRTTPDSFELHRLLRCMADEGCGYVVMEVSSHALVQKRTAGLRFAVGIFTNLTQDHLDYHGTMEAYRQAKGLLFEQCDQVVLNLDDEAGRWYQGQVACPVFTYSENQTKADLTAQNLRLFPSHVDFEALTLGQIHRIHLPIPGGFSIYNALACLSAGLCLGMELSDMAREIRSVRGVKGRVEIVPVPRAYTVLIDYAHTPNALENILVTARDFTAGRLICLFGCGGDRDQGKRPIMGAIAEELADVVVVTSDNPRTEEPREIIGQILSGMEQPQAPSVYVEPDRVRAIGWALEYAGPGDVIVLAGKGHETYQEVCGVQYPMDERKIISDWFRIQSEGRKDRTGNIPVGSV